MAGGNDGSPLYPQVMQRPGGRADRVLKQVIEATLEILTESGVQGVTVEEVGLRSEVSRTTIYRRWKTPQLLMLEALRSVSSPDQELIEDTGSLRGDLRAWLGAALTFFNSQHGKALFNALFLQPEISEDSVVREFFSARFARAGHMIDRAKSRGELRPDVNGRLVVELLASPIYFRLFFTRDEINEEYLDAIVEMVLLAAKSSVTIPSV